MMYKPLPDSLTIKKSKVDGLGLFAKEDIIVATNLGISHIKIDDAIIRTPLGGFINHSDNPNCFMVYEKINNSHFHFKRKAFAIRPIKKGEEITAYYSLEKTKPNV